MTIVLAVGIDLVDVDRVEDMLARHGSRLLERLLTARERDYCLAMPRPAQHVAARLAAKEAAYKALQGADGARAVGWRDSEVVLSPQGLPSLEFHGRARGAADLLQVSSTLVSLTHTDRTAAAVVVLMGGGLGQQ